MKNSLFLDYYMHLQYQVMYQKLIDLEFASIGFCKIYDSPVFNLALVNSVLKDEQINRIESEMKLLDRKPSVYFENRDDLSELVRCLELKGYKKSFEDSWMFHDGLNIEKSRFSNVMKVLSQKELEVYLTTFDRCYQKDDPQNPYGELGGYVEVARNSWNVLNNSDKVEYFIVFKNGKPVAVATLTNFAGVGYISNVGSLKEVRGEGFGKLATLYCVNKSKENGNIEHCLATEEGQYPNEFYKRIGFKTRFSAIDYVKN